MSLPVRMQSHGYAFNQAWLTAAMIAQILLALDGDLAKAEQPVG